jgi:ankyrin repeat protein
MYIDLLATKKVLGMLENTLRNLPEGLKELDSAYDAVITRIQNQDDDDVMMAKQILTWLYYSVRPLSLQEIRHGLAVNLVAEADPDAIELEEAFLPDEEVIASVCAGIVTCHAESNTVSFIHYTTKEYFKRRLDRQKVEQFLHLEISIADTCLRYLSFEREEFERFLAARARYAFSGFKYTFHGYAERECLDWDIDICYPLFRYAARYWGDHVKGMLGQATKDLFVKFVRKRTCLAASAQALAEQEYPYRTSFPTFISGLYLVSFFGLKETLMMVLDDDQYVETKNKYDWTALHIAAERGHAAIIQPLIDKGANVNAGADPSTGSGITALHLAARNGHEKVLEILLENGAEIDYRAQQGRTALHWAAQNGRVGAITLLLNKGANLEAKSSNRFTPLHMAAQAGEEAAAKILIERGSSFSATADGGFSLLNCAARGGCVEVVNLALEKGFDVDFTTEFGIAHLMAAAAAFSQRRDDVVRLLLKKGADVSKKNAIGRTALQASVIHGFDTTVRLLLENGAEVDAQDEDGETALHHCAREGHGVILQMLLEQGANVNIMTKAGVTALHLAANEGNEAIVQYLVENGVDVAAKSQAGKTALELAAWNGHEAIVQCLLEHVDGELDAESWLATSQIFNVAIAGDEKAMQLLLGQGADITACDRYGQTALHMAAEKGHLALSKILLENGANVNGIEQDRNTPICRAIEYGHTEVVRLLIEHNADLRREESPVFSAINSRRSRSKVEILQLLLENGADPFAKDWISDSPLHAAARQGSKLMVKLLLEYGAVVGLQNDRGETALDVSIRIEKEDISNLLREKKCSPKNYSSMLDVD